jgi:hypothetical protein
MMLYACIPRPTVRQRHLYWHKSFGITRTDFAYFSERNEKCEAVHN